MRSLGSIVLLASLASACETPTAGGSATGSTTPAQSMPATTATGTALTGYRWSQPEGESWARSGWLPITGTRLAAIGGVREEKTRCTSPEQPCLRREGGLLCHCITLVGAGGTSIATADQLVRAMGAIDSAAKAADVVALLERDLAIEGGHLAGHVRALDDGWLVQVVRRNTFGCGNHKPTGVVLRVSKDGQRAAVGEEPEPPVDPKLRMCVD